MPEISDVLSGDPLFAVSVYPQLDSPLGRLVSLCYQIHGDGNTYYNLLTTEYTSVNGLWSGITDSLNLLTKIGVQAISTTGQCHRILVDLNQCAVSIDGDLFTSDFQTNLTTEDLIERNNNEILITLTNGDHPLRLEVECKTRTVFNGEDNVTASMLQLKVIRARNDLNSFSHGLMGQWQA